MALSPGTRLGPYEILAPLGAGGMGEVYRARDGKLSRDVAIKVLPPEFAADAERRQRFEQEARAASSLNHPSIVTVHDIGSSNSTLYIAMELVEGKNLRELLSGPLPLRRLLDVGVETADGLAKAHAAGIVHRDLKPENLIVTPEGHVKILDFGLAKLTEDGTGDPDEASTGAKLHTGSGQIMGTAGYMSPEQASGRAVDFRSDQFSLGAILYEMASGRRAFQGKSGGETLAAILRDQPESLSTVNPGLPVILRWIIEERCLAKDPKERYGSTWDLLRELRSLREHLSEASTGLARAQKARHARRGWIGLAAAVALLAWPAVFLIGKRAGRTPPAPPPTFRQITFQRGTIWSARFAPDGETVVYGAAWDERSVEPFLTRLGGPESRPLGFPGAEVLAVSSSGEVALSLERRSVGGWQFSGTLARVALAGGSPRPILEDVQYADWGPDGKSLAIVREVGGKSRLEYPIGTVLYETAGWVSHVRVSPRDGEVAFLDHPAQGDDRGSVVIVDRSGRRKVLSGEWASEQGLAWSATGEEVWFTATGSGNARALHAVTLAAVERMIVTAPGPLAIHDISRDGRILLARDSRRTGIRGVLPGSELERDVSALDSSIPRDLSPDGSTLLIQEQGEGAPADYAVYLRRTQANSPPILLGEGTAMALSPDGRWILVSFASQRRTLTLVPTGAGEVRRLKETGLEYHSWGSFLPDGKRVVCAANEPGKAVRLYVQDLEGSRLRAISPEGVSIPIGAQPVSPDGRLVGAIGPDKRATLYSTDSGEPRLIPGAEISELPTRFASDGRSIFVFRRGQLPARVFRIDVASGQRTLFKEVAPSDPAGLVAGISRFLPTPDGKFYVYSASRFLSELYVADGLK